MAGLRAEGLFTPPSLKGTLVVPGNVGGMAWGGSAHDRVNDLLILPVNNLAAEVRLVAREQVEAERKAGRLSGQFEFHPQRGTSYGVVRRFLLGAKTGLPCTPPPWGTLAAVKATTGEIAWRVPLGRLPWAEKMRGAEAWGSIALGGPIVTAGGLVFAAGTLDGAIYAFDVATIYALPDGTGYIVATDQLDEDSEYHLYPREGTAGNPHDHSREIAVLRGGADATDGIEISSSALGPGLPNGAFVAMNSGPRNFLVFRWQDVAAAVKPALRIRGSRRVRRDRPVNAIWRNRFMPAPPLEPAS
jgi:hypothetical protein